MFLQNIGRFPKSALVRQLRDTRLLEDRSVLPYKDAKIEIRLADPNDVCPSAFYVLKFELAFLALFLDHLAERIGGMEKIDTLFEYTDEFGNTRRMAPPVVEWSEEFGRWMLLDGEHRCYLARHRGIRIPMLFISGVNAQTPYPYLPMPQGWDSVRVEGTVPEFKLKRIFRPGINDTPETKTKMYRDMGDLGSAGSRKSGSAA